MNLLKPLWDKLFRKTTPMEPTEDLTDYQKEKQAVWDAEEARIAREYNGQKKKRNPAYGSNYTPPKKKRK
jgi:hypothetical protein